jgi:putative ABC transport system substrate-binding protein
VIVTGSGTAANNRKLIVGLVARYRLPAIHSDRSWVTAGAMVSHGPDLVEGFRRAASYVDRILRGEKPADLPVQNPTKYELVINLKTAKATSLLVRADKVIE